MTLLGRRARCFNSSSQCSAVRKFTPSGGLANMHMLTVRQLHTTGTRLQSICCTTIQQAISHNPALHLQDISNTNTDISGFWHYDSVNDAIDCCHRNMPDTQHVPYARCIKLSSVYFITTSEVPVKRCRYGVSCWQNQKQHHNRGCATISASTVHNQSHT